MERFGLKVTVPTSHKYFLPASDLELLVLVQSFFLSDSALVSSEQTKESRLQSVTEFLHKLKSGVWGFIADEDDCHDGDADISKNSYLGGSQPDLPDVDIQPAAPDAPPAQSTSNPI